MLKKKAFVLAAAIWLVGISHVGFAQKPKIYISFLWHMHQPIYWPYESINETEASGKLGFSATQILSERSGPYTTWPRDAVAKGKFLPHAGAQISFSGSLIENLNNLATAGKFKSDWFNPFREAKEWTTALGHPRLDMVGFGYFHPLLPLISDATMRKQIQLHRYIHGQTWGGAYSKGFFPTESSFSERMIPTLVAEKFSWVLVDNIHFDRAIKGYPWNSGSSMAEPNLADQRNKTNARWIQRSDFWAPTKTSAPFGYQPHYISYIEPSTGKKFKIISVPAAHYEGNEDGRGGFGALSYEKVLSQLLLANTDPQHPLLVVLHHDGDNNGGGSDVYYGSNFQNFVNWVSNHPSFEWTTIEDYLQLFPPDPQDEIHVEDGGWSGSGGDPNFSKWNGNAGADGYSSDRNSWAVLIAAENRVLTAEALQPATSPAEILAGQGNDTNRAWHYFLVGQTSCYEYWDGQEPWDSHPTRAANLAVKFADKVLASQPGKDIIAPSMFTPMREPYNPGETEWGKPQAADFFVWTFVYDVSGLAKVTLRYRPHKKSIEESHQRYGGGLWHELPMEGKDYGPPQCTAKPIYRAQEFRARVTGLGKVYVDYYVEAIDKKGNLARSEIKHTWVGGIEKPLPEGGIPDPDGGTGQIPDGLSQGGLSTKDAGFSQQDPVSNQREGARKSADSGCACHLSEPSPNMLMLWILLVGLWLLRKKCKRSRIS